MGDMRIEDELGSVLKVADVHIQDILRLIDNNISHDDLARTFCLQFIDPHGDTVFNTLQLDILVKEFSLLVANCRIAGDKKKLESLIELILEADTHNYVKFYGD